MAPLAGKPPFATDEPDSFYETPRAQPRLRQPKPADPNARTSAYDVYNNYLPEDSSKLAAPAAPSANRNSGIGAMLLNMGDDSDDDSDDDESYRRRPAGPPGISPPLSKNAALAAATGASAPPSPTRPTAAPQPPVQAVRTPQQMPAPAFPQPQQQIPTPIAAPRPGYAAPMATLNLARPEPALHSGMPQPKAPLTPIQIPSSAAFASPAPSTPHPLLPPMTPITAAFIRPAKLPAPGGVINVSFADAEGKAVPRKPIMRGNSEETLLPGRGEKGDDFWRRFSMVVKEETKTGAKESSWLRQTLSGSRRHSRWVWVIGMLLLLLVAGGIGLGVVVSRRAPSHQQPTAIGGSADNLATSVPETTAPATGKGGKASSSILHVSPTNTVARRAEEAEAVVTPAPGLARAVPTAIARRHREMKNRGASAW